jgi:hypothetical protein
VHVPLLQLLDQVQHLLLSLVNASLDHLNFLLIRGLGKVKLLLVGFLEEVDCLFKLDDFFSQRFLDLFRVRFQLLYAKLQKVDLLFHLITLALFRM